MPPPPSYCPRFPTLYDIYGELVDHFGLLRFIVNYLDSGHRVLPPSRAELEELRYAKEKATLIVVMAALLAILAAVSYSKPERIFLLAPLYHVGLGLVSCLPSRAMLVGAVRLSSGVITVVLSLLACWAQRGHYWTAQERLHYLFVHGACIVGVGFYSVCKVAQCLDYLTLTLFQASTQVLTGKNWRVRS